MRGDQSRREFLLKCARLAGGGVAGIAAIHALGLGAVRDAEAWGIFMFLGGRLTKWQQDWVDWDESAEVTLASERTITWLMENPAVDSSETAAAAMNLSGADLVLTLTNNFAGASGGSRLAYTNTKLDPTETLLNTLFGRDQFTLVWKYASVNPSGSYVCYLQDNDSQFCPYIIRNPNLNASFQGENLMGSSTMSTAGGEVYVAAWKKAGGYFSYGYKNGGPKPISVRDFTFRNTGVSANEMPNTAAAWTELHLYGSSTAISSSVEGNLCYIVASNAMLFQD